MGCATVGITHTKTQREILVQQEKLNKDARDFLAVAKELLTQQQTSPDDLKKVVDILDKSQSLLNAKVSDGEAYKSMPTEEKIATIKEVYQKNKEIQNFIEELNEKADGEVDRIIAKNVELAAIERHKYWENFRFYLKLFAGLAIVGAVMVYIPPDVSRSIITGFTKIKDKFNVKDETK